jgi:hypothetical protein
VMKFPAGTANDTAFRLADENASGIERDELVQAVEQDLKRQLEVYRNSHLRRCFEQQRKMFVVGHRGRSFR